MQGAQSNPLPPGAAQAASAAARLVWVRGRAVQFVVTLAAHLNVAYDRIVGQQQWRDLVGMLVAKAYLGPPEQAVGGTPHCVIAEYDPRYAPIQTLVAQNLPRWWSECFAAQRVANQAKPPPQGGLAQSQQQQQWMRSPLALGGKAANPAVAAPWSPQRQTETGFWSPNSLAGRRAQASRAVSR